MICILLGRPVYAVIDKMQEQDLERLREMERLCVKHKVIPTAFTPVYHFMAYFVGNFCENIPDGKSV